MYIFSGRPAWYKHDWLDLAMLLGMKVTGKEIDNVLYVVNLPETGKSD